MPEARPHSRRPGEALREALSSTTRSAALCPRATIGSGGVQRQLDRLVEISFLSSGYTHNFSPDNGGNFVGSCLTWDY